jgi:quercetin dioxygenase-like cupin family protein
MGTFDSIPELRPYAIWKGATARAIHGERVTVAVVDLVPNLDVPEHHHENEQVGFVLKGAVTMVVDGQARELRAGETYVIPSNVRHSARTSSDGASVVDVFAPLRSDWLALEQGEPTPGQWP